MLTLPAASSILLSLPGILGLILLMGMLLLIFITIIIGNRTIMPKTRSAQEILGADLLENNIDPFLLSLPWQQFELEGALEAGKPIILRGIFLEGKEVTTAVGNDQSKKSAPERQTIIFCHGYSGNRYSSFRFLRPFIEAGWNIVLWDLRGHGESGGRYITFGAREAEDLQRVHAMAAQRWPDSSCNLYGVSMGGATVLRYLARKGTAARKPQETQETTEEAATLQEVPAPGIAAAVSDCSFESLKTILIERRFAAAGIPRPLGRIIYRILRIYLKLRAGFDPEEIQPHRDSLNSSIPLLFVHGEADRETPVSVAQTFYNQRKDLAPTYLLTIPGAEHTRSATTNPERWEGEMVRFFQLPGGPG